MQYPLKPITDLADVPDVIFFDFDGVFTDNLVYTDTSGNELVVCSKYDSQALSYFRKHHPTIYLCVISSETNSCVKARCSKLGIPLIACSENKVQSALSFLKDSPHSLSSSLFLFNDINDIDLAKNVGYPVCVADASPESKLFSLYQTINSGGHGAIRELLFHIDSLSSSKGSSISNSIPRFIKPYSVGDRTWGEEIMLGYLSKNFTFKRLLLNKGSKGGLQYHRVKHEFAYLVSGTLLIRHVLPSGDLTETIVSSGSVFEFPPLCIHQEEAITDCEIIEVSTPHLNDRVRVEPHLLGTDVVGLPTTSIDEIEFL